MPGCEKPRPDSKIAQYRPNPVVESGKYEVGCLGSKEFKLLSCGTEALQGAFDDPKAYAFPILHMTNLLCRCSHRYGMKCIAHCTDGELNGFEIRRWVVNDEYSKTAYCPVGKKVCAACYACKTLAGK